MCEGVSTRCVGRQRVSSRRAPVPLERAEKYFAELYLPGCAEKPPGTLEELCKGLGSVSLKINNQHTQGRHGACPETIHCVLLLTSNKTYVQTRDDSKPTRGCAMSRYLCHSSLLTIVTYAASRGRAQRPPHLTPPPPQPPPPNFPRLLLISPASSSRVVAVEREREREKF